MKATILIIKTFIYACGYSLLLQLDLPILLNLSLLGSIYIIFELLQHRFTKLKKTSLLRHLTLLFLVAGLPHIIAPHIFDKQDKRFGAKEFADSKWVQIKDNNEQFSILFPKKPQAKHKQLPVKAHNTTLNIKEYSHSDNVDYRASSTKIPKSWTLLGSKYLFKSFKKEMEVHQGKVVEWDFQKHSGHSAMSYLIQNHEGGQIKGMLILVKRNLYQIETEGKQNLNEAELSKSTAFINSFKVS